MDMTTRQLLSVVNAWLKPHGLSVYSYDNHADAIVDDANVKGKDKGREFPTLPHAVEWALTEARKRDRAAAHDAGLKGWLTDAIEDGDDNE